MFLLLLSCSHFLQLTPWHFNSILNTERSAVISLLALFLSVTVMGTEPELKELKAPSRVKMERRIGEYHTLVTSQRHDWSLCSLSSFHTHTHTRLWPTLQSSLKCPFIPPPNCNRRTVSRKDKYSHVENMCINPCVIIASRTEII